VKLCDIGDRCKDGGTESFNMKPYRDKPITNDVKADGLGEKLINAVK
jgi:hypothetical protein